jgi:selenocysteine lyase/cysteine desulfurase
VARKGLLGFNREELRLIRLSGEENAGGIAALGKALLLLERIGMDLVHKEEQALTRYMLQRMAQVPGLKIYGIKEPDSPGFSHKIGVVIFTLGKMMSNQTAKELAFRAELG